MLPRLPVCVFLALCVTGCDRSLRQLADELPSSTQVVTKSTDAVWETKKSMDTGQRLLDAASSRLRDHMWQLLLLQFQLAMGSEYLRESTVQTRDATTAMSSIKLSLSNVEQEIGKLAKTTHTVQLNLGGETRVNIGFDEPLASSIKTIADDEGPFAKLACSLNGLTNELHQLREATIGSEPALENPPLLQQTRELLESSKNLVGNLDKMGEKAIDLAVLTLLALVYFASQWSRDVVHEVEDRDARKIGDPVLAILEYLVVATSTCYLAVLYYLYRLQYAGVVRRLSERSEWNLPDYFAWISLLLCLLMMSVSLFLIILHVGTILFHNLPKPYQLQERQEKQKQRLRSLVRIRWSRTREIRSWKMPCGVIVRVLDDLRSFSGALVLFAVVILVVPFTCFATGQVLDGQPIRAVMYGGIAVYTMCCTGVFVFAFRDDFPRVINAI